MNTLQGLPVDRVPVFAVLSAYGGCLTQTDLRTLFSNVDAYIAGQQAVQATFGLDLVLAPFDYSAIAEAFGGEVAWFADQAPNMKRPAARSTTEALGLTPPDPFRTGRLPMILESARKLVALYRGAVPQFAVLPGPCSLPVLFMGMEAWIETILFDETNTRKILELSGAFFVSWANALIDTGITALVVTESMAGAEIMERRLFMDRMEPFMRQYFGQVRGPMVFHHGGGRIKHMLDLMPGLPGVVGAAVSSKDDLAECRKEIGASQLLLGNLDNLSFPKFTADQIYARSMTCLHAAAPAGHYILCNSAADIPVSTPPGNVHAMLAASVAFAGGERLAS